MKALIARPICLFMLACALPVAAQLPAKVEGRWEITVTGDRGPVSINLEIEQKAEKLSGKLLGARGETASLSGEVKGNDVTIRVPRQTSEGPVTATYTGKVERDAMQGTMRLGPIQTTFTGKRVKLRFSPSPAPS